MEMNPVNLLFGVFGLLTQRSFELANPKTVPPELGAEFFEFSKCIWSVRQGHPDHYIK